MKIYACFTPSHRPLLEQHFLPSLPLWLLGKLELRELPQEGTGEFDTAGFHATCVRKVELVLEALAVETEPFLFSDVDVRFYGPVVEDLMRYVPPGADIAFQDDGPGLACTGFFFVRPNDRTLALFETALDYMRGRPTAILDQPAVNAAIATIYGETNSCRSVMLPHRYWTIGQTGKHWNPGDPVNPPAGMLMHHGNWTKGVGNKLRLLDEVRRVVEMGRLPAIGERIEFRIPDIHAQDMISRSPLGPTAAAAQLLEQQRARLTSQHHPMPLAIALQFWKGDKRRAIDLARLLADIEPCRRDDVGFVFARQSNCSMDREIHEAMLYVGKKFTVIDIETEVDETKSYPGICFDPWASAARQLADAYYGGLFPYHSALFIEADGCPLAADWIDRIKKAHAESLILGKYVTGPVMRYGYHHHVNGSLVMDLKFFANSPGLHRCAPDQAWDVFFANLLVNVAGPSQEIRNEHGMRGVTENQWWILAKESAWLTSVKDGTPQHWARMALVHT